MVSLFPLKFNKLIFCRQGSVNFDRVAYTICATSFRPGSGCVWQDIHSVQNIVCCSTKSTRLPRSLPDVLVKYLVIMNSREIFFLFSWQIYIVVYNNVSAILWKPISITILAKIVFWGVTNVRQYVWLFVCMFLCMFVCLE